MWRLEWLNRGRILHDHVLHLNIAHMNLIVDSIWAWRAGVARVIRVRHRNIDLVGSDTAL